MNITLKQFPRCLGLIIVLSAACASNANKTDENSSEKKWPTGHVTMVVPFAAGGSIDRLARLLAPALYESLGVNVVVENRDGAQGIVGFMQVIAGPDDGSMFVLGSQPYFSNSLIKERAPYAMEDWSILAVQENDPGVFTVRKDSPYNTLGELIEAIRKDPDKIKGGVSAGGAPQLQLHVVKEKLGNLPYREVTYEGTGYRNAILGGHVDFVMSSASGDLAMKDQVKVIAVADDNPFPGWENAKSINEQLKPYGVTVPYMGTVRFVAFKSAFQKKYPERWETFKAAYAKAVSSPSFQELIKKSGEDVVTRKDPFEDARKLIDDYTSSLKEMTK